MSRPWSRPIRRCAAGFRTNTGFANATGKDTIVEIVLYGDIGQFLGSKEKLLGAY